MTEKGEREVTINASSTDQSALLQGEADELAELGGGRLTLPAGTIVGSVALGTNVALVGAGVGATTLLAPPGHVGGVVRSRGFEDLTNTASQAPETRGAHRIQISDLTIDGNRAHAPASVGVQLYGAGWRMADLRVRNCGRDGIHTEFGIDVDFSILDTLEGFADRVVSCGNGGHGWLFRGPHDSNITGLVCHSNDGWGLRNESRAGFYNGTLGHCARSNLYLNRGGGWYAGAGVASHAGGQVAGESGVGLEIQADVGSLIIQGLLVAGWTTGAILRGVQHNIDLTLKSNTTGVRIDRLGASSLRTVGNVRNRDGVGISVESESMPNRISGIWDVAAGGTMTAGTFQRGSSVELTQVGGAGNSKLSHP